MNCENAGKLLSEMVFGGLGDEQRTELSEHLADCESCSETLAGMRRAAYLVREGLEAETPVLSPERREAVLGKSKKTQQSVRGEVRKPRSTRRHRIRLAPRTDHLPLFTGMGAAAAGIIFVIIIAGMFVPGLFKSREEARTVTDVVIATADTDGAWEEAGAVPAGKTAQEDKTSGSDRRRSLSVDDAETTAVGGSRPEGPSGLETVARYGGRGSPGRGGRSKKESRKTGNAHVLGEVPILEREGETVRPKELEELKNRIVDSRDAVRKESRGMPEQKVFKTVPVNPFVMTKKARFSTFAINVGVTSYTRTRGYIRKGDLPPAASVRMEEFVNAFDYNYSRRSDKTFAVHAKAAPSPFGRGLTLLKIGIKGRVLGREGRKPAHFVFVVDASASMARQDRMPLIQYGLTALVAKLKAGDRISLVTYSTQARLILEAAPAEKKKQIAAAVRSVRCDGSTNMVKGLALGYLVAGRQFRAGEINRVILCSDGVVNVGAADAEQMLKRVETFRNYGVTFSNICFGMGVYNDVLLERLAKSGDGTYSFCDSRTAAGRIFGEEMSGETKAIARDAKIEVEFNPRRIRRYRLIGYESRDTGDDRSRDGAVDAGKVGSGRSATALYEVELLASKFKGAAREHLGKVYVRYRNTVTGKIEEVSHPLKDDTIRQRGPEKEPRYFLAACAAEFAEILRASEHAKDGNLAEVQRLLEKVTVKLPLDQKIKELLWMVKRAQELRREE